MPETRPFHDALDFAERLAELERLTGLGTAVWTAATNSMDASVQMRRNYDLPLEGHLTREAFMNRVHPDDRARLIALRDEARASGRRVAYEHRVLCASGQIRYMQCTSQVFLKDGVPVSSFTTAQDITAQRQTEMALARDARRLTEAEAMAGLGSWEMELATWAVSWSENMFRLCGVDPGSTMPSFDAFRRLLHPDDETGTVRMIRESVAGGHDFEFQCRIVRPDGDVRTLLLRNRFMRDGGGQPVRLIGTVLDVTERQREHDDLVRLKAIVEASDDAIIGATLEGLVESWSGGAERATGWSAGDMLGRPLVDVIAPDTAADARLLMERVKRGEPVHDAHGAIITRDGRRLEVLVSMWPVYDASGHVVGTSSISRHMPSGGAAGARGNGQA